VVEDTRETRLRRLAAKQHSVFTRQQALRVGFTRDMVDSRLRNGSWTKIHAAVYAIGGSTATWHQSAMAFTLLAGEGAALSHLAAAFLHGLIGKAPKQLDAIVPHTRRPRCGVTRGRGFASRDIRHRLAIPVTCVERTIVDLAARLTVERLEAVVDTAFVKGLTTADVLRRYIRERGLTRLRGVGRLRRLLDDRENGVPESELERRFERLVGKFRLPAPDRQVRVGRRRVDFMYETFKVIVELDGRASHERRADFEDDRVRQNEIALALKDYVLLAFTWEQVTIHPEYVAQTVQAALNR
jgi:very-short-patch-repair endonuclease